MVPSATSCATTYESDDDAGLRELASLWVIVHSVEDIPATPQTTAMYAEVRRLLDRRLLGLGLDPAALERFLTSCSGSRLKQRIARLSRPEEYEPHQGFSAHRPTEIGRNPAKDERRVDMAHAKTTGKKAASAASAVLRNPRSGQKAKSAAASALSQTHGKAKRGGKKGR